MSEEKKEEKFRRRFGSGDGSGSEGEGGLLKLFVNPEGNGDGVSGREGEGLLKLSVNRDSDRGGGDGDGGGDERVKSVDEMFARFKTTGEMTVGGFAGDVINVEVITGDAIASDVTAWKTTRAAAATLVHGHFLGKAEDEVGGRGWVGREDDRGEKYSEAEENGE